VDTVPDPLLRKSGSAGNRTRASGSVARNSDHSAAEAVKVKKCRAIPVIGLGGPQGCETSRIPYFLDNWLTDGGETLSLIRRPLFNPQNHSWYSFVIADE
jgi:hypothetical protein